jgi:hypothetical protein
LLNKTESNSDFALFSISKGRFRFKVMFKKFYRRINVISLFFAKSYLLNTTLPTVPSEHTFSGHEKPFLGKISKTFTRRVPLGSGILKI